MIAAEKLKLKDKEIKISIEPIIFNNEKVISCPENLPSCKYK